MIKFPVKDRELKFIQRLNILYPDFILISDYVDSKSKVKLKHKTKGFIWEVMPKDLNGKRQCKELIQEKKCWSTRKLTKEQIQVKLDDKYGIGIYTILDDSSNVNQKEKIRFRHNICGNIFYSSISLMLYTNKLGCNICYTKKAKSISNIQSDLNKITLKGEYTVLDSFIKDGHTYIKVQHNCSICNNYTFTIRASRHGQRCPKCNFINNDSKSEKFIENFLKDNYIKYEKERSFDDCKYKSKLRFDFFLPDFNTIIEYDGIQHFKEIPFFKNSLQEIQKRDIIKNNYCIDKGIKLIRINYKQDLSKELDMFIAQLKSH